MKIELDGHGEEAVRLVTAYVKKCLQLGGIPLTRTQYGGLPFESESEEWIMLICYAPLRGRLPTVNVYASKRSESWRYFWNHVHRTVGAWRDILGMYGELVKNPDKTLERYGIEVE